MRPDTAFSRPRRSIVYASQEAGFTLIELMVAMVIGVLVIMGATQLFIASQQNYRTTTALANMQDTGRFALETMSRELREVDFRGGCPTDQVNEKGALETPRALEGFSQPDSSLTHAIADTHAIAFRGGPTFEASNPSPLSTDRLDTSRQLQLLQSPFRCSLVQNAPSEELLSVYYPSDRTFVWTLNSATYYLGRDENNSNAPALRRLDTSGDKGNELLASHVAAMQARYLIDQQYLTPESITSDQWGDVHAIRISLIVQSERTDLRREPTTISSGNFNSNPFSADDGRLYQVFTTTISLRNRQ